MSAKIPLQGFPVYKGLLFYQQNIPVNGAVLTVADEIMKTRPFSLIHGGVLDTRDIIGIRKGNAIKKRYPIYVFFSQG